MATVTHAIGTADTGVSPNTTGAFTPAANDLLVVFVVASATVDASGTLSSSAGTTFSFVTKATFNASGDQVYCFVADSLSAASSQTVTWTHSSDVSSGTNILVFRVAGMGRTGASAIRQSAKTDNGSAAGTPAATFASSALTGNVTLGCVGNNSNPAGVTPPASWTENATDGDIGYNSPATGGETVFRDSGFTGTTITWGSTSATTYGVVIVELDTTAVVPRAKTIVKNPVEYADLRGVAGFAVAFGASAALLAPAPAPPAFVGRPIIVWPQLQTNLDAHVSGTAPASVGTDVIGAAEYTVGTHQLALAESQPRPKLWGTAPPSVAAPTTIGRPVIVIPQEYTNLAAYIHGTAPPDMPRPLLRTLVSGPALVDDAYASVWGRQPDGIDVKKPGTLVAAPEHLGFGSAKLWGPLPPVAVVPASPIGKLLSILPQQQDSAYGITWGLQPEGIDKPPPKTLVTTAEQPLTGSGKLWGPLPPIAAALDSPLAKLLSVLPQQPEVNYSSVWGPQPDGIDVRQPTTLVLAPQQTDDAYALLWGPLPPPIVTTDVVDQGQTPAGRPAKRRKYVVEIDGQDFIVESEQQAIALLDRAKVLAKQKAEADADLVVQKVTPRVVRVGKAQKIILKPPVIAGPSEFSEQIQLAQREIRQIYLDAAVVAELKLLLLLKEQRDEEEAILLLID